MGMNTKILILNGPNLNMLGLREPEIYGSQTLDEILGECHEKATSLGFEIDAKQSNHEGELVDWIQSCVKGTYNGLIINAAAYTHTSIAIHDALKMLDIPIIEVHLSDPSSREEFRHHSFIEALATNVIKGKGPAGYIEALEVLQKILNP